MNFNTKYEGINYFLNLGYEIKEGPNWFIVIPKQEELKNFSINSYFHHKNKECIICNSIFDFGNKNRNYCLCIEKIFIECNLCHKYFKIKKINNKIINLLSSNKIIKSFCGKKCTGKNNVKIMHDKNRNLLENDQEWAENQRKILAENGSKTIHFAQEALKDILNDDSEKANEIRKIRSETGKTYGPKTIHFAQEAYWNKYYNDDDFRNKENERKAKLGKENIHFAQEAYINLFNDDKDFHDKMIKILIKNGKENGIKNIKKAHDKNAFLWENDQEWAENQRKILAENGKKGIEKVNTNYWNKNKKYHIEISQKNLKIARDIKNYLFQNDKDFHDKIVKINQDNIKKAQEVKIEKLKKLFEENPIHFNSQFILFEKLQELKKNDICGAWVIKAKFKDYMDTNRENEIFYLGPFKSKTVYDEMDWAFRVISQPEKQDKFDSDWTIAKWWYIANLYYDFNFELLTDENGIKEEEALIAEAAYASKYDLFVEFTEDEEGRRIPVVEKHAYWNP